MGLFTRENSDAAGGLFSGGGRTSGSLFSGSKRKGGLFSGGRSGGGGASVAELQAQEAELSTMAEAAGINPEDATRSGPSPIQRVVDILARSNYASAGFVEAAATGDENPFARAFREFFSGAFGLKGDKKTYTEVFDELGMEQGPKLFETSAPGLAADIFLDPVTYLSFGAGPAIRAFGAGGKVTEKVALSVVGKARLLELEKGFRPQALRLARKLARISPEAKLAKPLTQDAIRARVALTRLEGDEIARQMARSQIVSEAAANAAYRDAGGIKFFGHTIVPSRVFAEPTSKAGRAMLRTVEKAPGGRDFVKGARAVGAWLDKTFNEVPAAARKMPGYNLVRASMRDWVHNALRDFRVQSFDKGGFLENVMSKNLTVKNIDNIPVGPLFKEGMPLNNYIALHLSSPERYPIQLIPEDWRRATHQLRTMLDEWFGTEMKARHLTEADYRENYFPQIWDNTREELQKLSEKAPGIPKGTVGGVFSFGPWGETRAFQDFDHGVEVARQLKEMGQIDFELKPLLNLEEVLNRRAIGHFTAVGAHQFFENVKQQFSKSRGVFNSELLEGLLPEVRNLYDDALRHFVDSGDAATELAKMANADLFLRIRQSRPKWMGQHGEEALRGKPKAFVVATVRDVLRQNLGREATAKELAREVRRAEQYLAISESAHVSAREAAREAAVAAAAGNPQIRAPFGLNMFEWRGLEEGRFTPTDAARGLMGSAATEANVAEFAERIQQFKDALPVNRMTRREAYWLANALQRDFFVGAGGKHAGRGAGRRLLLQKLKNTRQVVRATFLQARLERIQSLEELSKFVDDFKPLIDEIDPTVFNLTKVAANQRRQAMKLAFGERMVYVPKGREEVKGFGGWWLPEALWNDVKDMQQRVFNMQQVRGLLNTYDVVNDFFKLGVTLPFLAFHTRNAYSNVAQMFVSIGVNALNPVRWLKTAAVMAGMDGTLTTPLRRYTFDEVRQLANEYGVLKDFDQLAELRSNPSSVVRRRILGAPVVKTAVGVGAGVENSARLTAFMKHLQDGMSPEEAAARVKEFLFDYEALSVAEKDVLARLFPFYKWTRKNIELTAEQMVRNPGRYSNMLKPFNMAERGPERDMLPFYLRGDIKARLRQGPGKATFITGIDLPVNSALDTIFTGDVVETMRQKAAMVAPAIKTVLETASGHDFFSGRSLEERQQLGALGDIVRAMPDWVQDYLEFNERIGPSGQREYSMNGLKFHLIVRSWAQARFLNTADRLTRDPTTSFGEMLLDISTGFRTREIDVTTDQAKAIKRNIAMLQKRLKARGVLLERPIYFEPKP